MENIAFKYNRQLINIIAIAPFVAYLTDVFLNLDFKTTLQFFSYIGVALLFIFKSNRYYMRFPKYLIFYLLFILYVFYSDLIRLDREFKFDYLFKNYLIGGFNFMLILENLFITKKHFDRILKISRYILIIAFLVIIYQQVVNENFMMSGNQDTEEFIVNDNDKRLYSIYSYLGTILACGLTFVPIYIIVIEDLYKKKKRLLGWLLMGVVFAFLTKQRWLMINFSLVFFLFFINYRFKFVRFIKYALITPVFLVTFLFGLDSVGIDAKGIFEERILEKNKKNLNQTSASTRLLAYKAFNILYWEKPIFGTGNIKYGMGGIGQQDYKLRKILKGRSSQIHVGYLSIFYLYGLIGAFLFLSFLFLLLKKLYMDSKVTYYWAPFLGFLGVAIDNFVDVNFKVFEMGLIIALFANKYYTQSLVVKNDLHV